MKIRLSAVLVVLLFFDLQAQNIFNPVGAEAWGVGGASVASQNIWAVFNNPAAISRIKKIQGGITSEQRFHESKLTTASAAVVIPSKFIHVGAGIHYFGYTLFNQQKLSLSVSKQLFDQLSIGATFSYFGTNISEQPHAGNMLGELGIHYAASPKFHLGLIVFNLTQSRYSANTKERIPTYARLGLSYNVSDKIKLMGEMEETLNQEFVLRGGCAYQLHEIFSLSIGVANNPVYLTGGTSVKLKQLKADFAVSIHEVLGITPHIGLSFPVQ